MMNFKEACATTLSKCNNEYAKAYAKAGINMDDCDEVRVQSLYILNNISHWRGDDAKACRETFKRYGNVK